jgi:hypothetical protein
MNHERLGDKFSCLIEKWVRSGHAVSFGDENRFGEFIAVFGRRSCQSLNLKGWKAETQLYA